MATLHVELSDAAYEQLTAMAEAFQMPISDFLEHISQPALSLTEEQQRELDLSIAEADAGDFATDDELRAAFAKFKA